MSRINLSSMLGMKTGDPVKPAIVMEPQSMLTKVVLPSQIKYKFKYRNIRNKRKLDGSWRKYHDIDRLENRVKLRASSQLGVIKDDAASFLWGPAQLSAAAIAWDKRQKEKKRLAQLHRERKPIITNKPIN